MANDPLETLGLPREADQATIRKRYLELVRQNPPDRAPQRFAEIRAAYDELRDPVRRLEQRILSNQSTDSVQQILADVRTKLRSRRIPMKTLLALGER